MFNACVVPFVELANVASEIAVPEPTELCAYCAMQFTVWACEIAVETYCADWLSVQVPLRVCVLAETVSRATPPVLAVAHSVESIFDIVEKFELCASVM